MEVSLTKAFDRTGSLFLLLFWLIASLVAINTAALFACWVLALSALVIIPDLLGVIANKRQLGAQETITFTLAILIAIDIIFSSHNIGAGDILRRRLLRSDIRKEDEDRQVFA